MTPSAAVVTVSDGVHRGTRVDRGGEEVAAYLSSHGFDVLIRKTVPDEAPLVSAAILEACGAARLVVTTGGTGFGPRDVTPEATTAVLERPAPGLQMAMFQAGMKSTPMAALSRAVVGSLGTSLVINLPGSPRGAVENLAAIIDLVPHVLDLLAGITEHG